MPPKELPGFYYDPEKNRYFPIRGPIPGASTRRPPPPAPPTPPPAATAGAGCSRKMARRPELLSAREMYGGGVIFSNKATRSTFKQQYHYVQASQPMVWKYQETNLVADKALEQLSAMVQTPQGLRESRMLVTGSMNGSIRLYGLGSALHNFWNEIEFLPQPAWTPMGKHNSAALPSIWSSEAAFTKFSSSITCIKNFGLRVPDASNTNSSVQRAWWLLLDLENLAALCILWIFQILLTLQWDRGLPLELLHLIVQCGQLIAVLIAHMQLLVWTMVLVCLIWKQGVYRGCVALKVTFYP
ncbi:unnamed protein product [Urochloa humidicola]